MSLAPAPGFDDPLALLRTCHERILQQCATLEKIADHLTSQGASADARGAALQVHRYFTTAGRHHHDDEEQDLFPLLRGDATLAVLIDQLEQDHVRMDQRWQGLEPWLRELGLVTDTADFMKRVSEFNADYAQHIARENQELLPRATALLPAAVQTVLGARMAARRGVSL